MKRHRFDPVSFLWGALFVGLGIAILTDALPARLLWFRAFWPFVIVVLGLAILSSLRRETKTPSDEPAAPPTTNPPDPAKVI